MLENEVPNDNRRESMRARVTVDFCVTTTPYAEISDEGDHSTCFSSKTVDISVGGACITHNNNLKLSDKVEMRTKNNLTHTKCLNCQDVYFMGTEYELMPISGVVVWVTPKRAGIRFTKLSVRNENIISKLVWDSHIKNVRDNKDKSFKMVQRGKI